MYFIDQDRINELALKLRLAYASSKGEDTLIDYEININGFDALINVMPKWFKYATFIVDNDLLSIDVRIKLTGTIIN